MLPSLTVNAEDGSFDRRVASERGRPRRSWGAGLARLAVATLLGALLVAATPVPFGHPGAASLALLLAVPPVLAVVLLGELARLLLVRRRVWRAFARALSGPVLQGQIVVAGSILLVGCYASNLLLVDLPLGRLTTSAYLMTAVLAVLAAVAFGRLARGPGLAPVLARIPGWAAVAVTIGLFGCAGVFADAVVLPGALPRLHHAALALVIASFAAVGSVCARRLRSRSGAAVAMAGSLLLVAAGWLADRPATRLAALAPPTIHTLLLDEARHLLDRDGDGFSAALDGGDCDDTDPRAYPLSRVGRDCLGWMSRSSDAVAPRPPLVLPAVATGPAIIVMVTIDAFRCGFGQPNTGALRDVCPQLTAMAVQGRARLDGHSEIPNTENAMRSLHLGGQLPHEPALASLLAQAGYRTHAILTHRNLMRVRAIPASFDSIDSSLVPAAADLAGSTAAATTDLALAWLRAQERTPGKLFLWAHYYDPHDPYVREPGSMLVFDHLSSYSAEVRRTDAEVGRLAEGLRRLARAEDVLLLAFADHGEAFGEHGRDHHFTSIHEESARIPFVAWSPGPEPGRFVKVPLPAGILDVRAFMMALLGGAPFQPSSEVLVQTPYPDDTQVGIITGGWKLIHHLRFHYDELYDLSNDPREEDDRASGNPAKVTELGKRLGARLLDQARR
jgi:choline-sulfatase